MDTGVDTSQNSHLAEWLMIAAPAARRCGLVGVLVCASLSVRLFFLSISSYMSVSVNLFAPRGERRTSWLFDLGRGIRFWCWWCETNAALAPLLNICISVRACDRVALHCLTAECVGWVQSGGKCCMYILSPPPGRGLAALDVGLLRSRVFYINLTFL